MKNLAIIARVKMAKHFLWLGIAVMVFGFKIASGQDTSTNQPPSGSDYTATLVSPSDTMSAPTAAIANSPALVLVQQQPVMQADTGNVSLQQTAVTPTIDSNTVPSQIQN